MSAPLVIGAIKLVGGVMAAKTAIEGIKEGNLLKAAIGGVGAYFSFSGLAAGAGSAGTSAGTEVAKETVSGGATTLGAEGTTALTETVAQKAAADAAKNTVLSEAGKGVVKDGLLDKVGGFFGDNKVGNWIGSLNDKGSMLGQGGFLERMGGAGAEGAAVGEAGKGGLLGNGGLLGSDYARGQAVSGGLQFAGNYMQGDAMEQQAKWKLEQDRKDYEGQRARRAAIGNMNFMNDLKWNPQSGRFEQAQTA